MFEVLVGSLHEGFMERPKVLDPHYIHHHYKISVDHPINSMLIFRPHTLAS